MPIQKFEEMKVWQDSRGFVKIIYALTSDERFKKDFGMKDQIQRAAISVMSNIAEGYERDNNKEFIKFLGYSKGSIGEIRSLLYIALELKYISVQEFNTTKEMAINISTQIANFIKYLRKRVVSTSK
jgi:four helix bundle protein